MLHHLSRAGRFSPARACLAAIAASAALAAPASADPNNNNSQKLQAAVTLEGVREHQKALQDIADAAGGNRFAGLPGHDNSAQYVIRKLREAGYNPTTHEFTYNAFFERSPSQLEQVSPNPRTYVNGNDFRIMQYSGSGHVTAPVEGVDLGSSNSGCEAADFAGFTTGRIALVKRGGCTFRIKTTNAAAAGASAILIYNNIPGGLNGTLSEAGGLSAIPSLGLPQDLGESLRGQLGAPLVMRVRTLTGSEALPTYNVLAETAGGDPDNVVMVGAHLDSVTAGPGINDNGSGSAAILEVAEQMAKVNPHNKVRFAWWSAEESGLVGAARYVEMLSKAGQRDDIALYLNFDMVGSPNFARFVYDGDNSAGGGAVGPAGSDVIERVFYGHFESKGLAAEPTPFNGRSDYGPFIAVGIPAGGLFTGAEGIKTAAQAIRYGGTAGLAYDPCYHAACDTFFNNSDGGLDQMSDAIAHSVITFGQNTEVVNEVRGKGNFKRPAEGANDGAGTGAGGGGGLHDHHEEEAE